MPDEVALRQSLLDAIPAAVFIVDQDLRIEAANRSAAEWLALGRTEALHLKSGDALHCINAASSELGCGHTPACRGCTIRDAVGDASKGVRVHRRLSKLTRIGVNGPSTLTVAISASPLEHDGMPLIVLTLEDVTELVELRGLLPRCAWCGDIRDSTDYWQSLEAYFKSHHDLDFTHTICESCHAKHFGD